MAETKIHHAGYTTLVALLAQLAVYASLGDPAAVPDWIASPEAALTDRAATHFQGLGWCAALPGATPSDTEDYARAAALLCARARVLQTIGQNFPDLFRGERGQALARELALAMPEARRERLDDGKTFALVELAHDELNQRLDRFAREERWTDASFRKLIQKVQARLKEGWAPGPQPPRPLEDAQGGLEVPPWVYAPGRMREAVKEPALWGSGHAHDGDIRKAHETARDRARAAIATQLSREEGPLHGPRLPDGRPVEDQTVEERHLPGVEPFGSYQAIDGGMYVLAHLRLSQARRYLEVELKLPADRRDGFTIRNLQRAIEVMEGR